MIGRLTLALLLWWPLLAAGQSLSLRPLDASLLRHEPRDLVTAAFRVQNDSGRAANLEGVLELPPGWRAITPEFPFALAAGASTTRIVSFLIPQEAAAADYRIVYRVQDRERSLLSEPALLPVQVLPLLKLQTERLESPDFVVAGAPYRVVFALRNGGNAPLSVLYRLHSSLGYAPQPASDRLELAPGAVQQLVVDVPTEDHSRPEQDILTLTAEIVGSSQREQRSAVIRLLPRVTGRETPFHTLPSVVSLHQVVQDGALNWQAELRGAGTLDGDGQHNLAFLLRGPDGLDAGELGLRDDYWISYWSEHLAAHLGDKVYALSPLTEYGRYGAGADLSYRLGDFTLHGYFLRERFAENRAQERAVSLGYALNDQTQVTINYLDKQDGDDSQISSLRGVWLAGAGLNLDLEFAHSSGEAGRGQAARAYLYGVTGPWRYLAQFQHADPAFRGYYQDQDYGSLEAGYAVTEQLDLHGYYRYRRDNLDSDPARPAPLDQEWSIGGSYRLPTDTQLSVDYRQRTRQDQRSNAEFDSIYRGVRIGVNQRFQHVSLHASGEWGATDDTRLGSQHTQRYRLSAYWQPLPGQTYSAYFFHDSDVFERNLNELTDPDDADADRITDTVGINAAYQLGERSALSLNLQQSQTTTTTSELYQLRLDHRFSNGQQLALTVRQREGDDHDHDAGTAALLTYSIPFDLPVRRRKDVATLRGRVFDAATEQGIAGLALNLGDRVAVSDSDGYFAFPSVALGTHQLALGKATALLDKVPAVKLPLTVDIRYGQDNRLEIPLAPATAISGRVVLHNAARPLLPAAGPEPRRQIESWVHELAPGYQLDPALVLAVISAESNFNSRAVSAKNAQGLMQLIPATAARFQVTDPFDPRQNLQGGMAYLRWLLDRFAGDVRLALAGYNAGEQAVANYGDVPPYPETQAYVARITEAYQQAQTAAKPSLQRMLVVLSNGEQDYRRLTDSEGGFHIAGLPAGRWTVRVENGAIPDNFRLEQEQIIVEARPGAAAAVEFRIVPRDRQLKLLTTSQTTLSG